MNEFRHLGPDNSIVSVINEEAAAGRRVRIVPAGADKAESLQLFAEVLHFPDYVGHNLDALYDALRTLAREVDEDWSLVWDGTRLLRAGDPTAYDDIVGVLQDVSREAPRLAVTVLDR